MVPGTGAPESVPGKPEPFPGLPDLSLGLRQPAPTGGGPGGGSGDPGGISGGPDGYEKPECEQGGRGAPQTADRDLGLWESFSNSNQV